ncbi:SAM-dependent methyltransferase [Paucibacter sp. APW11]|uniref:SAM-dependent methyltransferase n=1 Tax=Roseateles aquae TaxID=3077235 RepID=A0ABU3PFP9_9BURK|nr:SAM-dependent methyltransferase [Paucibacter sp. APW11]MDT9001404.1 SAM-dependent methyltransferase [Paucibacter sp. APW11]
MFTSLIDGPTAPADAPSRFMRLLALALQAQTLVKLKLGKPLGDDDGLDHLQVREILLRGERQLSLLWRYRTKDVTKNHSLDEGLGLLQSLLGTRFAHAHLITRHEDVQLAYSRKGRPTLRVGKLAAPVDVPVTGGAGHDKDKQRYLDLQKPFWLDLGLAQQVRGEQQLVPAMARKWKQINKFIEIFAAALKSSGLDQRDAVHVADFGSGKGYLTFAMHDWLRQLGKDAQVTGVELREDMVRLCGDAAARHGLNGVAGLRFDQGDVRSYTPARIDVMIALHACDIATDYAIHLGLRAGAQVIMCSPCCHKQLRPQMKSPALLKPLLQHGIHLGQEAEMVTDGLRALLLDAEGYDTQVFEFVALEHTSKNKMILAVRRNTPASAEHRAAVLAQIDDIKRFYGIREQALQSLLAA